MGLPRSRVAQLRERLRRAEAGRARALAHGWERLVARYEQLIIRYEALLAVAEEEAADKGRGEQGDG